MLGGYLQQCACGGRLQWSLGNFQENIPSMAKPNLYIAVPCASGTRITTGYATQRRFFFSHLLITLKISVMRFTFSVSEFFFIFVVCAY